MAKLFISLLLLFLLPACSLGVDTAGAADPLLLDPLGDPLAQAKTTTTLPPRTFNGYGIGCLGTTSYSRACKSTSNGMRIYCNGTNIVRIPCAVYPPNAAKIVELNLNNNNITTVYAGTFGLMYRLQSLDLSHNEISSVRVGSFTNLSSLRTLDLSYNSILSIKDYTFQTVPNLQSLNLAHNLLTAIWPRTLRGANSLVHLDVSDNLINLVYSGAFDGMDSLQTLTLANNIISYYPVNVVSYIASLERLDISNNSIIFFTPGAFSDTYNLKYLNASNNYIEAVQYNIFVGTQKLEVLDLSHNWLTFLPRRATFLPQSLRELHVGYNELEWLGRDMIINLVNLYYADFSNNLITTPDNIPVGVPPTLRTLKLHNNRLNSFPDTFFILQRLTKLTLSGNPFDCCTLGWRAPLTNNLLCDNAGKGCAVCALPASLNNSLVKRVPNGTCYELSEVRCPLPPPDGTTVDPFAVSLPCNNSGYRSACNMTCIEGFRVYRHSTPVWVCESDEKWHSDILCIDRLMKYRPSVNRPLGRSYYFSRIKANWSRAEEICQIRLGNLVSINSQEEEAYVAQRVYATRNLDESVWIGLGAQANFPSPPGPPFVFGWSDGSLYNYTLPSGFNNTVGNPANACVSMAASMNLQYWQAGPCSEQRKFICEVPLDKRTLRRLKLIK